MKAVKEDGQSLMDFSKKMLILCRKNADHIKEKQRDKAAHNLKNVQPLPRLQIATM